MAQLGIREYDGKKMFFESIGKIYPGIQIRRTQDMEKLELSKRYIIKPDMLFGKRGKRGLLGLNLEKEEAQTWLEKYFQKEQDIDGVQGKLDVFLAEEYCNIEKEYYISFFQSKDGDTIVFSPEGGIDVEDNWEKTRTLYLSFFTEISQENLASLGVTEYDMQEIITQLRRYYKDYGFTYLEINPLARDKSGVLRVVDMVAKIDDCELFRQKQHWNTLEFPHGFGFVEEKSEQYIRELDSKTGASLKMKILNPQGYIWTLFAGGGGSLVMSDSIGALGLSKELANYGELSGNPSREFTREYTRTLVSEMLKNSLSRKYLIIAGAIANFTDISETFLGIIDILEEKQKEIIEQQIKILVRRGGINEEGGITLLRDACNRLGIEANIQGSEAYMTNILYDIKI